MWVRFNERVVYETIARNEGRTFDEGAVYNLSAEYGQRWINRGVAVEVEKPGDPEPEPVEEKKPDGPDGTEKPSASPVVARARRKKTLKAPVADAD